MNDLFMNLYRRSTAPVAPAAKVIDGPLSTISEASKGFDASSFTFDLAAADEACDTW